MKNTVKVYVFDTEGKRLYDDFLDSTILGLQEGAAFWFGTDKNRTWAKVSKLVYGLDTNSKSLVVEIILDIDQNVNNGLLFVSKSDGSKSISSFIKKTKFIDYGEKDLKENKECMWVLNDGDIIVKSFFWLERNCSREANRIRLNKYKVDLRLQVTGVNGYNEKKGTLGVSDFLEFADEFRRIICTLKELTEDKFIVSVIETKFE